MPPSNVARSNRGMVFLAEPTIQDQTTSARTRIMVLIVGLLLNAVKVLVSMMLTAGANSPVLEAE
ncbi:hypothetical protein BZA77DRAFT_390918 [Pyronema omphalodes]|nr:hypothetical protein BZA77DRAFT_390918 [Pyronema omphalodes]